MAAVSGGHSSLEMICGRLVCPQCRAPMWSIRVKPEKTAEDNQMFQCPRCECSHHVVFPQRQTLVQRR
jgi:transposase-like protein